MKGTVASCILITESKCSFVTIICVCMKNPCVTADVSNLIPPLATRWRHMPASGRSSPRETASKTDLRSSSVRWTRWQKTVWRGRRRGRRGSWGRRGPRRWTAGLRSRTTSRGRSTARCASSGSGRCRISADTCARTQVSGCRTTHTALTDHPDCSRRPPTWLSQTTHMALTDHPHGSRSPSTWLSQTIHTALADHPHNESPTEQPFVQRWCSCVFLVINFICCRSETEKKSPAGCLTSNPVSDSGERPFECKLCQKRFTLKHSMMRHQRRHMVAGCVSGSEDENSVMANEGKCYITDWTNETTCINLLIGLICKHQF